LSHKVNHDKKIAAVAVLAGGLTASLFACTHMPAPMQGLAHPNLAGVPVAVAGGAFHRLWYDGNAELSGYRVTTPRYGEARSGEMALIYVTEPMNRRTWVKDDDAAPRERVNVLKLNQSFGFLAGIYPYSVMTSVFAPIDDWGGERFAPVKITITVQEWCGHVFQALWPGRGVLEAQIASYFASEGEARTETPVPVGTLYEDALLIQLRELDGPFAGGGDWTGSMVPSLWRVRRQHAPVAPVAATIRRSLHGEGDKAVTRFVLEAGNYQRTFDIEIAAPRRVLGWTTSDGEEVRLRATTRLPYWTLNHRGDERYRDQMGIGSGTPALLPAPASGTTKVGF